MNTANVAARLTDRHVQANLGDRRALDYGNKHYSYHDLAALANRAGNLLKSFGVTPGSAVLVMMPPSPGYIATIIGALKIGATAVVEQPTGGTPALAVVHADYVSKVHGLPAEKVVVAGDAPEGHPSFLEAMRTQASSLTAEPVKPEAPALVVGGNSLSHAQLDAMLDGTQKEPRLGGLADILRALAAARPAELS